MRARRVNEQQSFERDSNPKKALNLGLDCQKYVKLKLSQTPYNKEDDIEQFWSLYYAGFEEWDSGEYGEHVIHILDESFKNPKYMMEYMDSEIENYIDFRQETDDPEDMNEQQEFERGEDPKKAMGLGIKNWGDYVIHKLGEEEADKFFTTLWDVMRHQNSKDLIDDIHDLVQELPLEKQIEWADGKLEWWKEMKEEYDW